MTTELVISNWRARSGEAGAIMAEETGEMKVKAETIAVAAHLRLKLQLRVGGREGGRGVLVQ